MFNCVSFSIFSNRPRDRLGRTSPKWPILCRVGRKTSNQHPIPNAALLVPGGIRLLSSGPRHHLSNNDCLGDKWENYHYCSVVLCTTVVHNGTHTHRPMSSS